MKKVLAIMLAIMMCATLVFTMVACGPQEPEEELNAVQKAIKAAEGMTLVELEAAAKAEMEASGKSFKYSSLSSGVAKAVKNMKAKYSWLVADDAATGASKDQELYNQLGIALSGSNYLVDFVMIQDGVSLQTTMIDTGLLYSYNPVADDIEIDSIDRNPLACIYYNKTFMWRNTETTGKDYLTNIWQLTKATAVAPKAGMSPVKGISFQDPTVENINMNFLISLTSPESCAALTTAYKEYTGNDYVVNANYPTIGHFFIECFIKAVTTWHTSDTTAVKTTMAVDTTGTVFFAGVCKLKEYPKGDYADSLAAAQANVWATGYNTEIKGTNGFVYKMWTMIPKTALHPYTSCLLMRYMLSQDGFNAGWTDIGYYSSNNKVASSTAAMQDPTLAVWKTRCLIENNDFIASNYSLTSRFIKVTKG